MLELAVTSSLSFEPIPAFSFQAAEENFCPDNSMGRCPSPAVPINRAPTLLAINCYFLRNTCIPLVHLMPVMMLGEERCSPPQKGDPPLAWLGKHDNIIFFAQFIA